MNQKLKSNLELTGAIVLVISFFVFLIGGLMWFFQDWGNEINKTEESYKHMDCSKLHDIVLGNWTVTQTYAEKVYRYNCK